jgi:hypothetical protein
MSLHSSSPRWRYHTSKFTNSTKLTNPTIPTKPTNPTYPPGPTDHSNPTNPINLTYTPNPSNPASDLGQGAARPREWHLHVVLNSDEVMVYVYIVCFQLSIFLLNSGAACTLIALPTLFINSPLLCRASCRPPLTANSPASPCSCSSASEAMLWPNCSRLLNSCRSLLYFRSWLYIPFTQIVKQILPSFVDFSHKLKL